MTWGLFLAAILADLASGAAGASWPEGEAQGGPHQQGVEGAGDTLTQLTFVFHFEPDIMSGCLQPLSGAQDPLAGAAAAWQRLPYPQSSLSSRAH